MRIMTCQRVQAKALKPCGLAADSIVHTRYSDENEPTDDAHPFRGSTHATLDTCPVCGEGEMVRLVPGWAYQVNHLGESIPIIGCGNPWHYAERGLDTPEGWVRPGSTL